jgi:hypothetical protein
MGLNYGFEIIAPRDSAARLIEALAAQLAPDDAGRVLAAVREGLERFMDLARRPDEERHLLCLTFLFEPDDRVAEYDGIYRISDPVTGRVPVGCVWSSLHYGDRFVLFRGTAATTAMSLLFEGSPGVQGAFAAIGERAGADLVTFHDDDCELIGVWPRRGRSGVCVTDEFEDFVDGEWRFRVDPYCMAVLDSAALCGP